MQFCSMRPGALESGWVTFLLTFCRSEDHGIWSCSFNDLSTLILPEVALFLFLNYFIVSLISLISIFLFFNTLLVFISLIFHGFIGFNITQVVLLDPV